MNNKLHYYSAYVIRVHNGNTFRANVDLGFYSKIENVKIQLANVSVPDLYGNKYEDAIVVRNKVRKFILNKNVILYTIKGDKRWLANVYIPDQNGSIDYSCSLNELLLKKGWAESYL